MPAERRRDNASVAFAVGFILLGGWVLWRTAEMSAFGSVFPRAIATGMIVFSAALIAVKLLRPRPRASGTGERESTPRRLALVLAMLGWILLLPVLGFVAASLLGFAVLIAIANYDRWTVRQRITHAVAAVALVVGFYLLFGQALNVPLPRSSLF
jgi:putative tricarboxylic transport membrane protein